MNEFATRILTAPPGKTYLFSTGQAGFIIKSVNGQLLGIDLYLSDSVERVEGHMGYKRMLPKILNDCELEFDAVITTHPHRDHFDPDSIPVLMANNRTQLFASVDCEKDVKRLEMREDNITYVKPGDSCTIGDFVLDFIRCDHGTGAPDAVGVIITTDEKRILETGDTCLRLDWCNEYLSKGMLDVLIAPINGAFGNLDEQDCAKLSNALNPGLTVPCHYGMFASHGGNPGKLLEIMEKQYQENKIRIMTQGEMLALE